MSEIYNDAVRQYYDLKKKYDSRARKRRRRKLPPLNKCISCKKNSGTLFTIEKNIIKAICGAKSKCKLHIEIELAKYNNIYDELKELNLHLEEIKQDIIETKLNLIFNFNKKNNMKGLMNDYNLKHERITILLEIINRKYKNTEEKKTLYSLINDYKNIIEDYIHTKNSTTLTEALELYLNELMPLQKTFREKLYTNMHIEKGTDKKNRLIYTSIEKHQTLIKNGKIISNII